MQVSSNAKPENSTDFPERFVDLKRQLVDSGPEGKDKFVKAWNELLEELAVVRKSFKEKGSDYIPQVEFAALETISSDKVAQIKKCGCLVIRNVVDDDDAVSWKEDVKKYADANPAIPGFPEDNRQFFHMYWSKSQVKARSHPNVIAAQKWLNSLYHSKEEAYVKESLVYADRLRIRQPGPAIWSAHPPHIDGGSIERWEDPGFRNVYSDILRGNWKAHDPYDLEKRLNVDSNIYKRPGQSTIFRTFQGWLAMSDTAPNEGTLQVFPDVTLSNSYLILRPFFRPVDKPVSSDPLDPENWQFDVSQPDFPGIFSQGEFFIGPRISDQSHPHLKVSESMISVPHVKPGDMVFWHCDVIHAVEFEHHGKNDSSVMYIPSVPATPKNAAYVQRQKEHFLKGNPPPDFPQHDGEVNCDDVGTEKDFLSDEGRKAMGLEVSASA